MKAGVHGEGALGSSRQVHSRLVKTALALAALSLMLTDGAAYHPMITDNAPTQGKGNFLLELNAEGGREKRAGTTGDSMTDTATLMYGAVDSMDMIFNLPYQFIAVRDGDPPVTGAPRPARGNRLNEFRITRAALRT